MQKLWLISNIIQHGGLQLLHNTRTFNKREVCFADSHSNID